MNLLLYTWVFRNSKPNADVNTTNCSYVNICIYHCTNMNLQVKAGFTLDDLFNGKIHKM